MLHRLLHETVHTTQNNTYHFRFQIPENLRSILNKKEITRSLKTDSHQHASIKVSIKLSLIQQIKQITNSDPSLVKHLFNQLLDFSLTRDQVLSHHSFTPSIQSINVKPTPLEITEGIERSTTTEYLLSKAWSDFRDYKSWSEKGLKNRKTAAARRKIPVHPKLIESGVLTIPRIEVDGKAVTDYMNIIREKLNVPINNNEGCKRVFHSFRHTFITKGVSKGVTIKKLKTIVGHSKSLGVTSRYIHGLSLSDLT